MRRTAMLALGFGVLFATLFSVPLHASGPQVLHLSSFVSPCLRARKQHTERGIFDVSRSKH